MKNNDRCEIKETNNPNKIKNHFSKEFDLNKNDVFIKNLGLFIFSVSVLIIMVIAKGFNKSGFWINDMLVIKFIQNIRNNSLSRVAIFITTSGNAIPMTIITLIASILLWNIIEKRVGIFFGLNILSIWMLNDILKHIFKRPRPSGKWLVSEIGFSMPSSHAMVFMGFSLLLSYFVIKHMKERGLSIIISILILIYAILVGLSRVYVGVHYLSDVIIGWSISGTYVPLSIALFNMLNRKYIDKKVA